MKKAPKLLLLAALPVSLLAACGGCADDSSSTTEAPVRESTSAGSGSSTDEASAAFRTPGGANRAQSFGEEADAAELKAASTALAAYMEARAEADGARACAHLARESVRLLSSSRPSIKVCAATYALINEGAPPSSRANTMVDGVASLRVEGHRGFAFYHGAEGIDYFTPMVEENGEWKVLGLEPNALR